MDAVEFSIDKARKAQTQIAHKVIAEDRLPRETKFVAGVDVAYFEDFAVGGAAILDYEKFEIVETQVVTQKVKFPYIPTLFAFRELAPAVACIRKLKVQPDVILVHGHGRAHPYRCGLACHLGVALNKPTIGVASTKLIGETQVFGDEVFLVHEGEMIGAVVTKHESAKPVYVSVGNLVSLETAVDMVKHCSRLSRIPEPIRAAHRVASEERKVKIAQIILGNSGERLA